MLFSLAIPYLTPVPSPYSFCSTVRAPGTEDLPINLPPPHLQSFGHAMVSADGTLTVKLIDITGKVLYEKVMEPEEAGPAPAPTPSQATTAALNQVRMTATMFLTLFVLKQMIAF